MAHPPLARRLLEGLQESRRLLLQQAEPPRGIREGLLAVHQAVVAAVAGLNDEGLMSSPAAGEWSMAEVIEHMVEHDRHYTEIELRGMVHYVEHGLEHALQVWRLRRDRPKQADGSNDAPSATVN